MLAPVFVGGMMISEVYHWMNDTVMVFNEDGQHLSYLEGKYNEVAKNILEEVTDSTRFFVGAWNVKITMKVAKECFENRSVYKFLKISLS